MSFHVPEKYRVTEGVMASPPGCGNLGAFRVPFRGPSGFVRLGVIASDRAGWEHVSVSHPTRIPNWREMCFIKQLFWDDEDWVVQYHPPKQEAIDNHPFCLHLWRPIGVTLPTPPSWMV